MGGRKSPGRTRPRPRARHRVTGFLLVAEALSAFETAASEHVAPAAGRHALEEPMLLLAVQLLRLIGSEHIHSPSLRGKTSQINSIADRRSNCQEKARG